jgi:hypothetical protein
MQVKNCTEEVIKWCDMEEQMLRQKAKIEWLKLGDGNNRYFHASIKAKQRQCELRSIYKGMALWLPTMKTLSRRFLVYMVI